MRRHFLTALGLFLGGTSQAQNLVTVHGIAWDSLHGVPLRDALVAVSGTNRSAFSDATGNFTIDSVTPGSYRFVMQHDVLDSIGMSGAVTRATITDGSAPVMIFVPSFETIWRAACQTLPPASDSGLLFGTVRMRNGARIPSPAGVSASWVDVSYAKGAGFSQHRWRMDAITDTLGNYTLCGVPRATGIRVKVGLDTVTAESFDLLPLDKARLLRKDFLVNPAKEGAVLRAQGAVIDSAPRGTPASLVGRIVDSLRAGVAGAEVTLTDIGTSTVADDQGEFRLGDIPPGMHDLQVRKVGYGVMTMPQRFAPGEALVRTLYLDRVTALDSVTVAATAPPANAYMAEFATNKARGFGVFFDRAEIEKYEGTTMAAMLQRTPGITFIRGSSNQSWLTSSLFIACRPKNQESRRDCDPIARIAYQPEQAEQMQGMKATCYAQVYMDGNLMNSGRPTPPYDVNEISTKQVEAIEFYANRNQAPMKYAATGQCGVMIIHTRR